MKTATYLKKSLHLCLALIIVAVISSDSFGKCQSDVHVCDGHPQIGGTPTACNPDVSAWTNGSCGSGFSNYQCDDECVAVSTLQHNIVITYTATYTGNQITGCQRAAYSDHEVVINCPGNYPCRNMNGCE
jgi:hypothetical protein